MEKAAHEPTLSNFTIGELPNFSIALSLLSVKIHKEIVVLVQAHSMQSGLGQLGRKPLPDCDCQVLSSWNASKVEQGIRFLLVGWLHTPALSRLLLSCRANLLTAEANMKTLAIRR